LRGPKAFLGAYGAAVALSSVGCATNADLKKDLAAIREELASQRRAQDEQRRNADELRVRLEQLESRTARVAPAARPSEPVAKRESTSDSALASLPVVKLAPRESAPEVVSPIKAPPVDTRIPLREPGTNRPVVADASRGDDDDDRPVNLNAIFERTSNADSQYAGALTAYNDGNWSAATTAFKRFVSQFPKHPLAPKAVYWTGMAQQSSGKCGDAVNTWKGLVKDYPKHEATGSALFGMAQCETKLGHPDKARTHLERLLKEHSGAPEAAQARTTLAELKLEG
jgi:tol-pal system protein YbgF